MSLLQVTTGEDLTIKVLQDHQRYQLGAYNLLLISCYVRLLDLQLANATLIFGGNLINPSSI